MAGRKALTPMGWDAFGLPAENAAIDNGVHPAVWTYENIDNMRTQLKRMGISYDWDREVTTCDPAYYKWEQLVFIRMLERGLAYRRRSRVNWCPSCQTILANEQVEAGRCWRCDSEVVTKEIDGWFFKITDYADELLEDLDTLDWPERVKTMQRNWIGRSEGAEVTFRNEELGIDYPVFTTRPDTLFGATFFVMAPEHPDVFRLVAGTEQEQAVHEYVNHVLTEGNEDRGDAEREKTGVFLGRHVVNPVNGEEIPMFVADYVLMEYGTGAIMAVPAHDQRDFDFARQFDQGILQVAGRQRGVPAEIGRRLDTVHVVEETSSASGGASLSSSAKMICFSSTSSGPFSWTNSTSITASLRLAAIETRAAAPSGSLASPWRASACNSSRITSATCSTSPEYGSGKHFPGCSASLRRRPASCSTSTLTRQPARSLPPSAPSGSSS